jgi:hypothetical protein
MLAAVSPSRAGARSGSDPGVDHSPPMRSRLQLHAYNLAARAGDEDWIAKDPVESGNLSVGKTVIRWSV